ncbi:sphingosine 1-phosphate receptor 1-like [Callorhinchus milii]|nr:sphingosine 1-phosphate receptor 1-like [Callorhinchus milii]
MGLLDTGSISRVFRQYYDNDTIFIHYNHTGKLGTPGRYKTGMKIEAILSLIMCVFIVLENLLVLIAIWRNKKFHLPMYYLLANLTVSDLLAGVSYMVNILLSGANTLRLTPLLWFLREGGVFITLAASVFSLLAIAVERHITMERMKLYHEDKRYRMLASVAGCWAVAGLLGILPILGWNCIGKLVDCSTVLPLYSRYYVLCCIAVFIAILLAIVVLYVRIYLLVKGSSPHMSSLRGGGAKKSHKYMALLKTLTIVVSTFILCWLPLFILLLLDFFGRVGWSWILYKSDYFLFLAILNSALNPIIYTWTNKDMRRTIVRLLCLAKEGEKTQCFGVLMSECSSQLDRSSHRHEALNTTLSSGNAPQSPTRTSFA